MCSHFLTLFRAAVLKEAGPSVKATSRSSATHERLPLFALKTLLKFILRSNGSERQREALAVAAPGRERRSVQCKPRYSLVH